MREGDVGGVEVDRPPSLLGVDVGLVGVEANGGSELCGAYARGLPAVVEVEEVQVAGGLVALGLEAGLPAQSPFRLVGELQLLPVVEVHLPDVLRAERLEDVVLVVDKVFVSRRHEVVGRLKGKVPHGELEG